MPLPKAEPPCDIEYTLEENQALLKCGFDQGLLEQYFDSYYLEMVELDPHLQGHPLFEYFAERATRMFFQQVPERVRELLEDIVEEVVGRTLMEIEGFSTKLAKLKMQEALDTAIRRKKNRMKSVGPGRPKKNDREVMRNRILKRVKDAPPYIPNLTLEWLKQSLKMESTEALRKELKRLDLDWKELKKRT